MQTPKPFDFEWLLTLLAAAGEANFKEKHSKVTRRMTVWFSAHRFAELAANLVNTIILYRFYLQSPPLRYDIFETANLNVGIVNLQ